MERSMNLLIMEGNTPYLPDEIMYNILKRLSVKSLIRFQCVCKRWRNLIKTPSFIANHLHHSSHQNSSLIPRWRQTPPFHWVLLDSDMHEVVVPSSPLINSLSYFGIYGSSNGLLCINCDSTDFILLWNPATREIRQVPMPIHDFKGIYCIGFGFSPIVNDYKIVIIYLRSDEDQIYQVDRVEVYSLCTKSWREVEFGALEGLSVSSETVSINGDIFWFGLVEDESGNEDYCSIVSFDIANEVFTLMQMPDVNVDYSIVQNLVVYEDDLAMLFVKCNEQDYGICVQLWVMKEVSDTSGDEWIWTHRYTSNPSPSLSMFQPMTIWRNQIVYNPESEPEDENDETKSSLYLFNLATDEFDTFAIRKYGEGLLALNYVESLVSIGDIPVENT